MNDQANAHPDLAHPADPRRHAPAMHGRARLEDDTADYLGELAGAVHVAALEHTLAEATYGLRFAITPAEPRYPRADRTPAFHPVASMYAMLAEDAAGRVHVMRGYATYAAQWYVAGALFALEMVMTGRAVDPCGVERLLLNRNSHRPTPEVEVDLPTYGRRNRPPIPADPAVMATGHADLDAAVGVSWADLARTYRAAERLEAHDLAIANGRPTPPRDLAAEALEGDVTQLHVTLAAFGDAIAEAARLAHAAPAHLAA